MNKHEFYLKNEYGHVVESVAKHHGVTIPNLLGSQRARKTVNARADLAWNLHNAGLSSAEIGLIIDRDRTSVLHLLGLTKKGKIYAQKFNRKCA